MSVGEVSAALTATRQQLTGAAQQVLAIAETLTGRRSGLARLLQGSQNPRVAAVLGRLDAAVARLGEAAQQTAAAETAVAVYQAHLTGTSAPSGTGSRSTTMPEAPPAPRYDAEKAAEILPHAGRNIAVGRLYDADGNALTTIIGPGEAGAAEGVAKPYRAMRFMTHVEANAAAQLRRTGTPSAALYLNMRPCLGEDGCHVNLRDILPAGYRLTIFQVTPSGSIRVWPFTGTGNGLTDDRH